MLQASSYNKGHMRYEEGRRFKRPNQKSYSERSHGCRHDPNDHMMQHVAVSALEQRPKRSPRSSRSQKPVDPWAMDEDQDSQFNRGTASLKKLHVTVPNSQSNTRTKHGNLTSHILDNMDGGPAHAQPQNPSDFVSDEQQSSQSCSLVDRNLDYGTRHLKSASNENVDIAQTFLFMCSDVRIRDGTIPNPSANTSISAQNENSSYQLPLKVSDNSGMEDGYEGIAEHASEYACTDDLTQEDSDVIVESEEDEESGSEQESINKHEETC